MNKATYNGKFNNNDDDNKIKINIPAIEITLAKLGVIFIVDLVRISGLVLASLNKATHTSIFDNSEFAVTNLVINEISYPIINGIIPIK